MAVSAAGSQALGPTAWPVFPLGANLAAGTGTPVRRAGCAWLGRLVARKHQHHHDA